MRKLAIALIGLGCLESLGMGAASAQDTALSPGATLRASYLGLQERLIRNPFQRPLHLESSEAANSVAGEIHAVIGHPFVTTARALEQPANWCEILLLTLNIKGCRVAGKDKSPQDTVVNMAIGSKYDQPVEQAHKVAFDYRVAARSPAHLLVRLTANKGPLSTRDYRIELEAVPLDSARTFLRLSYSYGFGVAGKLAMQFYLATAGSGKVGFTETGKSEGGPPQLVGGMRGVAERNTMRYYLAIETFLDALDAPPQQRIEKSLRAWFAATERYARQLHELDEQEYLVIKRKTYADHG
jgi:hypothetical protein